MSSFRHAVFAAGVSAVPDPLKPCYGDLPFLFMLFVRASLQ